MSVAEKPRPQTFPFEVEFGGSEAELLGGGLRVPIARLDGPAAERIFDSVWPAGESHGFQLFASGALLIGCSVEPARSGMERSAVSLYRRLLAAAGPNRLYRIWNYVPAINRERQGQENYRAFSAGRSRAFQEALGSGYRAALPAASGVGCRGGSLAAVFVAGTAPCRLLENPEQMPAYRYPKEHGPRPPAFSRASVVDFGGSSLAFVSGTAAIKGHRSVSPGRIGEQLECTVDNLRLIFRAAGMDLDRRGQARRYVRVYLRRARDFERARERLQSLLDPDPGRAIWLQTPLCRRELVVEVESTQVG